MKTKSLYAALKRAGLSDGISQGHNNQRYITRNGGVLSWYESPDHDRVECLHWRREDDYTDLMTDYFAGFFPRTLRQAILYISTTRENRYPRSAL